MPQIESLLVDFRRWIFDNRRALFWIGSGALLIWLAASVREVTFLLLLSYLIALLVDPIVDRLERNKIRREFGIIIVGILLILICLLLLILIIPAIAEQYSALAEQLPIYITALLVRLNALAERLGLEQFDLQGGGAEQIRTWVSTFGVEQLKVFVRTFSNTVLQGYSVALMAFNLMLVPIFVFYISADLGRIHSFMRRLLSPQNASRVGEVAEEILDHVYAFFRGQITVAMIMATLYAIGLSLVGLPSGLAVGVIAGLLSIVPYLGTIVGITLATLITLVTHPGWSSLIPVWLVFGAVQLIEGTVLTPRIIGGRIGIHPLGVMLALIIAGQLFGIIGIVIAIPSAAALRVLFRHLHEEVQAQ